MLQQILKDMYIDPDVLEALNEDQKKTLFLKMRQEQVRRWQEREDKLEREGGDAVKRTKTTKANSKSVSWLLGRDGDVAVIVIGEVEELSAKFICSGLGEKKSPPSLQNNTQNQSILTNRKTIEPNRTVTECLSSVTSDVQLNKPKCEETSTLPPPSVSVSEHSSPPAADKQPDSKPLSKTEERSNPQSPSSICSRPLVRSNAVNRTAASGPLHIRAGVTGPKPFTAAQPPSPSTVAPISTATKTEPANTYKTEPANASKTEPAYISKAMQTLENHTSQEVLRGKDESRVTVRSALENATSSGKVTPPCTGRGRVALLMKAFSTETSSEPPQSPGQTPTRGTKPPLPTKPSHLRATTTPSVR